MGIAAYQDAIGRLIHAAQEGARLPDDIDPGLRFTIAVQRSWCEGRAARAAATTLALLPLAERRRLVAAYVTGGGGRASSFATEARGVLAFLATQLAEDTHPGAVCRLQQAIARAQDVTPEPWPKDGPLVRRGRHATLLWFRADPAQVLDAATTGRPPPPEGPACHALLVAPGLPGLARMATEAEVALWRVLPKQAGLVAPEILARLGAAGVVERG
jgi:putative intracellular protease/amidase